MSRRYDPSEIEPKWQQVWADEGLYRASEDPHDERPRFYALDMYPYPSGDLHMGHAEAFSGGDVVARYRWMRGYNVLHPIGWDSFGLPAENAAIKRGIDPQGVDRREHRAAGAVVPAHGHVVRLDPAPAPCTSPSTTGGPSGCSCGSSRSGLAYRKDVAGQLVPQRPDRARQRAGDPGGVRALRRDGRAPQPDPVVLQDHRLRAAPARRHGRS